MTDNNLSEFQQLEADIKLAKSLDKLITEIETISEDHYYAAWYSGIEYQVWAAIHGRSLPLPQDTITRLQDLSDAVGGWVAWLPDDEGTYSVRHVPRDEWVPMAKKWGDV